MSKLSYTLAEYEAMGYKLRTGSKKGPYFERVASPRMGAVVRAPTPKRYPIGTWLAIAAVAASTLGALVHSIAAM